MLKFPNKWQCNLNSYSISGRFDFIARSSTLSHQETNHTSLLCFAFLHFQCWTNTLHTMLTFRAINKQLCGPVIGIFGSLIWPKTLMEIIFNPCGEFRWRPEDSASQIHSPQLHIGTPGIFSDLLRSVQILKRDWGAESNGKLPHLFCLWTELQSWCLSLQWKTCPWAEHSDDDDDDSYVITVQVQFSNIIKIVKF